MPQLHPWITSYPEGVRWDTEIEPGPVQKILDDAAAKWPERPALDFMGKRLSYRELKSLADRAAKGLQALGVGPGIHVGLYLPNTPHYVIAFFGVLKAGGTVVNYSPPTPPCSSTRSATAAPMCCHARPRGALPADGGDARTRLKLVVGNMAEMWHNDAVVAQMKAGTTVETGSAQHVRFAALPTTTLPGACDRRPARADRRPAVTGGTTVASA
jgi:long-chain acyl-CoA synthetase